MGTKEAPVQKWVRDQMDQRYRGKCVYIKYHAGQYATRGVSDLIFCVHGLYVAIEVKTDTGKPTKLQEIFLEKIRDAGGIAHIIYGKDAMKMADIFNEIENQL